MTEIVPTIATRIRERAQSDPSGVALREKSLGIWQETTWSQYGDLVERAAHGLVALGVRPGDRVAIQSDNRPEWLVADAGAVAARAVTTGLDAAAEPERSDARVLIAEDQEQVDKALAAKARLPELEWIVYLEPRGVHDYAEASLVWWPDLLARGDEHRAEHSGLLDRLAERVTDDDPVADALSAGEVNLALASLAGGAELHPDPLPSDFVLCHLPLSQITERLHSAWLNAHAGVQVHFGEPTADLVQTLNEVEPSLFLGTPQVWGALRARVRTPRNRLQVRAIRKRLGMRKCRSALSAAGPVAPELLDWYLGLGIPVRPLGTELVREAR
jgi:long-chain acyl-CoA synthetase